MQKVLVYYRYHAKDSYSEYEVEYYLVLLLLRYQPLCYLYYQVPGSS